MDQLDLPIVQADTSIAKALGAMRKARVRAVVVQTGDAFRLLRNAELLGDFPGVTAQVGLAMPFGAPVIRLQKAPGRHQGELDAADAQLGVIPVSATMVRLITRHEYLAHAIRNAPKICKCDGHGHLSADPSLKDGDPCDYRDGRYKCY